MSRLSRNKLKNIVKECLVEILQEGLTSQSGNMLVTMTEKDNKSRKKVIKESKQQNAQPTRGTHLDNISYATDQRVNEEIANNVSSLTSDPVLAAIFEDTARTTMQQQISAERRGPTAMQGDAAHRKAAASDPTELFEGASAKWAQLAFSD